MHCSVCLGAFAEVATEHALIMVLRLNFYRGVRIKHGLAPTTKTSLSSIAAKHHYLVECHVYNCISLFLRKYQKFVNRFHRDDGFIVCNV